MKDIKAILEGFTLTDEDREAIIKEVGENYRSIVEVTKKSQRIEELENQNKALTEQVNNLEGDGEELENLRKQISDFEAAEEKRKADENEAAKRDKFRAAFNEAVGERTFTNDVIRDAIFEKAYKECGDDVATGAKEAIEKLTKDTEGIWTNPQRDVNKMPSQEDISGNKDHKVTDAKKTISDFMFGK